MDLYVSIFTLSFFSIFFILFDFGGVHKNADTENYVYPERQKLVPSTLH